jgi:Na+/H+-dicarboxylate symporter
MRTLDRSEPARGRVPIYVWTFLALVVGILSGGAYPEGLEPVATGTAWFIRIIVAVVPFLIFVALSPAIATLARRGLAGRFAGSVILWYVLSSTAAGLFGVVVSSLVFRVPFSTGAVDGWSEAATMIRAFGEQGGASLPLLAIVTATATGIAGAWIDPLYRALARIERGIASAGGHLGYAMIPLILAFGITLGVRFGASVGIAHYATMTLFTALLCASWWAVYVFVILRLIAQRRVKRILTEYYLPTAIFAAGTCSSLATLPVNLANVKKVGVRDEVADFVIPFGAVANLDASALAYVAYAPFVLSFVFGMEVSWTILIIAWPAVVLFTIAAPGLPAGMGTALWSSALFASMLGLEDPVRSQFIATWLALAGGLPDMFRTATNCTGDGFTAILFDSVFGRLFERPDEG